MKKWYTAAHSGNSNMRKTPISTDLLFCAAYRCSQPTHKRWRFHQTPHHQLFKAHFCGRRHSGDPIGPHPRHSGTGHNNVPLPACLRVNMVCNERINIIITKIVRITSKWSPHRLMIHLNGMVSAGLYINVAEPDHVVICCVGNWCLVLLRHSCLIWRMWGVNWFIHWWTSLLRSWWDLRSCLLRCYCPWWSSTVVTGEMLANVWSSLVVKFVASGYRHDAVKLNTLNSWAIDHLCFWSWGYSV